MDNMERIKRNQRAARMERLAARKSAPMAGALVLIAAVVLALAFAIGTSDVWGGAALVLAFVGVALLMASIGGALARGFNMPEQKGLVLGGLLGPLGWVVLVVIWAVRKD